MQIISNVPDRDDTVETYFGLEPETPREKLFVEYLGFLFVEYLGFYGQVLRKVPMPDIYVVLIPGLFSHTVVDQYYGLDELQDKLCQGKSEAYRKHMKTVSDIAAAAEKAA